MIDPSFDTQTVEIVPPFPPTMQELEQKIVELESNLAAMTQNFEYWKNKGIEYF